MTDQSPTTLTYPSHIRWVKQIPGSALESFSKSQQQKISHLDSRTNEHAITFDIKPLTHEHAAWFQTVYSERLEKKHNPQPRDIVATTINNTASAYRYDILTLYVHDQPLGATIFTKREDRISIVYRSYPYAWPEPIKSRCSPALYAEYLITDFTRQVGLHSLVHGQDKNLYGLHSAIGVAQFKLSVGCQPTISKKAVTSTLSIADVAVDTFVLLQPEQGIELTEAILLTTTPEAKSRYEQLLTQSNLLTVTTIALHKTETI